MTIIKNNINSCNIDKNKLGFTIIYQCECTHIIFIEKIEKNRMQVHKYISLKNTYFTCISSKFCLSYN